MNGTRRIPKATKPRPREVVLPKRQSDGTYTLRMNGYSRTEFPAHPFLAEMVRDTKPRLVTGLVPLPVTFEVIGAGERVTLTLDRLTVGKGRSELGFTRVEIVGAKGSGKVSTMPALPLETLLREAVKLASVLAVRYPPGYSGPAFADLHSGETIPGVRVEVGSDEAHGFTEVVGWADTKNAAVRSLAKSSRPPKATADSPERLRLVARTWKASPEGTKTKAVHDALRVEEGAFYGIENVRRLIKKCRAQGLIPPSPKGKR